MSYKVETIERKDPIVQLEPSKSSIKGFFNAFLNKTKGFKYQITEKVFLKEYKSNGEMEFAPVYFNSVTKTVINHRFRLESSFQEILYMIDVWISKGSDWKVESIKSKYIDISTYRPLSGSFYMNLPVELRCSRKGLINIKNTDEKCFLWCHVRHINPSKENPESIKKTDKKVAEKLHYDGIEFPVQGIDFNKIEVKNNICINVLGYESKLVSDKKFEDSMDLLLLIDDDKSHYVYSKTSTDLCFTKQKIKTKNGFVEVVYSVLVGKVC